MDCFAPGAPLFTIIQQASGIPIIGEAVDGAVEVEDGPPIVQGTFIMAGTMNNHAPKKSAVSSTPKKNGYHQQQNQKKWAGAGAARARHDAARKSVLVQETKQQKEKRKARDLLDGADAILKEVDESPLLQHSEIRNYPTFDKTGEVDIGPLLGVGGFCNVYEIKSFHLKRDNEEEPDNDVNDGSNSSTAAAETETEAAVAPSSPGTSADPPRSQSNDFNNNNDNDNKASLAHPILMASNGEGEEGDPTASSTAAGVTDALMEELEELGLLAGVDEDEEDDEHEHEEHYDISKAREHMRDYAQRTTTNKNGTTDKSARYAIKKLRPGLGVLERARGMIDLSIEAKFLSVLWHPNIVKMRAMASGPTTLDRHFFVIMDRLYQTLDKRIKDDWAPKYSSARGNLFGLGAKKEDLNALLLDRLVVAYDLSNAFDYMHENQLVYRDVKKENIAFDVRGDVKIFDFGLSKAIGPDLKARDSAGRPVYGYNLTPRTGSIPFMAPEIVECKPYDEKCDVFSFAVLLWEILALKPAFKGYNRRDFLERVVRGKQRLPIDRNWPPLTRGLIKEAWDDNPQKRPTMKRISAMMNGDLKELSNDPKIRDRANYMKNRSTHSLRKHMAVKKRIQSKHSKHSC